MPTVADPLVLDWSQQFGRTNAARLFHNLHALSFAAQHDAIRYSLSTPNSLLFVTDSLIWCLFHRQGRADPVLLVQAVPYVGIATFVQRSIELDRFVVVEETDDDLTFGRWVIVLARRLDDGDDIQLGPGFGSSREDYIGFLVEIGLPRQSGWIRWTRPRGGQFHGRFLPVAGAVYEADGSTIPDLDVALQDSALGPLLREL